MFIRCYHNIIFVYFHNVMFFLAFDNKLLVKYCVTNVESILSLICQCLSFFSDPSSETYYMYWRIPQFYGEYFTQWKKKHAFCSDVYISLQIWILLPTHFLVQRFNKRYAKNTPWYFKGTSIHVSATKLHACIFYSDGSHVCFWINRNPQV